MLAICLLLGAENAARATTLSAEAIAQIMSFNEAAMGDDGDATKAIGKSIRANESEQENAEAVADKLADASAEVVPAKIVEEPLMGPPLVVNLDGSSQEEVVAMVKKMRRGKAAGPDGVPAEYFKALLSSDTAIDILTAFLSECWQRRAVPDEWHLAHVTAIYKKGSIELCGNYRPN